MYFVYRLRTTPESVWPFRINFCERLRGVCF